MLFAFKGDAGAGQKLLRLSPPAAALVVDLVATNTTGWYWGADALLAAGWATTFGMLLPWSHKARRRARAALARASEPVAAITPGPAVPTPAVPTPALPIPGAANDAFTVQVRQLWERAGLPARTVVMVAKPHPGTDHDFTMILRAAEHGRPIVGLETTDIAAAFQIDPADAHKMPVAPQAGRPAGPGWLEVEVTPDAGARRRKKPTNDEKWADTIGREGGPIPGSKFLSRVRNAERGVTYWRAVMEDASAEPRVDIKALCKTLGASYEDGRTFVTTDGPDILVSQWDVSPLAKVYPATRELLTPDAEGRYVTGYLANGQPARNRVYTERGAAHGLFVAPSGGGKTQLMALAICADTNSGASVWLATETPDEKTTALGRHIDRQGAGALYMLRSLRATFALMEIRAAMPWADGTCHDYTPGLPGCPYGPHRQYLDEFLSAARHPKYGAEIMDLAEQVSVKGRKYNVGEKVAGQSVYVQDGFTQLLLENLRENSIPVVLKVAARKVAEMFRALGIAPEDIPDPLPRSFSKAESGRLERIMKGEPEPPADGNTGGAGWIIETRKPEVLRTLFMNFEEDISPLFPSVVGRLTDHEIRELDRRGLLGDWHRPDDESEDEGPDLDDWGDTDTKPRRFRGTVIAPYAPTRAAIASPEQAMEALKRLTTGG
ncbi:chromosome segregation protein ParM (plasmid) [Actinacidiphila glaucinigra]|uniref:chromosome segregation protein ParM n=1 Tax=Actinacidiphila glaucinigra TaxID=235986 RepID=UPI002DD8F4BB|nr:chromosome segregation protein ParM [Actinacidiphila glaucinigra]WSD65849.1 chromosome segregation protein ParM [Actinacidiphila glaucinigra]